MEGEVDVDGKEVVRGIRSWTQPRSRAGSSLSTHSFGPAHCETRWYANIFIPATVSDRSFNNAETSDVPDRVPKDCPNQNIRPNAAADEKKSNRKSTASATAKFLRGVGDSADASSPLKSVSGGLYFIPENCEVCPSPHPLSPTPQAVQQTNVNQHVIEPSVPKVKDPFYPTLHICF